MAIKEYRLGDIVKPQSLKRVYEKDWATNGIPFLKVEDILKIGNSTFKPKTFIPEWLFINLKEKYKFPAKGSVLLTTGGSVGNTWIYDGRNCWFKDSAIRYFECDENKMLNKYLYLWFIKNKDLINHSVSGSVMKIITSETINNWKIILPDLQTQQEIINIIEPKEQLFLKYHNVVDISDLDKFKKTWSNLINIIEPFEKLIKQINDKKELISKICFFEIINSKPQKTMIENEIIFEKGKNVNSIDIVNDVTNLPFINVSAINNKINKFISSPYIKKNVEYGDVILSLDGTIGLVNNFLEGYNGYGYKVFSKNNAIDNSIIYFSLLNPINQKIIFENSNGSVIKHASKSKNKILLFNFLNENLIRIFFKYDIVLKMINKNINKVIEKLINLFIF